MQKRTIDVNSEIASIQVTDADRPIYEKAVITGMRILSSTATHARAFTHIDNHKTQLDVSLALTAVGTTGVLLNRLHIPKSILLQVSIVFAYKLYDFLVRAGDSRISEKVLYTAIGYITEAYMKGAKASPDQIISTVKSMVSAHEQANL